MEYAYVFFMTQKAETHFLLYLKYNRETQSALSTVHVVQ